MKRSKRVLVTPLNWGLGHATRCIPIIYELLQNGFEVILASDGRSLQLLQKEFPKLQTIELPAYNIRYSTNSMIFNIAFQTPKILLAIWKENRFIKKIVKKEKIDIIISDNRYGCKNNRVKNIFITHQINIIIPFKLLQWLVNKINHLMINQFDECWIPDIKGNNSLAGKLSTSNKIKNVKYLGPLSRLKNKEGSKKYDIIAILSGPEPQRTHLENIIIRELKSSDKKCLIVQGCTDEETDIQLNENIQVVSYMNSKELNEAILASEVIICRSGYSSVMDLVQLNKNAILIPTPGQTEQEYLAQRLARKNLFCVQSQETFSLEKGLKKIKSINSKREFKQSKGLLKDIILELKN